MFNSAKIGKAKIEVVPTAKDRLREAYAKRRSFASISSELTARLAKLAPFETAVAEAQADLERIEKADANAMREWVSHGANGAPPVPDSASRTAALRKLAYAEASLKAAGVAKGDVENQLMSVNTALRDFTPALHAAIIDTIGEELFVAIEKVREANLAQLECEAYFKELRQQMQRTRDQDAGNVHGGVPSPQVSEVFTHVLQRIAELSNLSNVERQAAWQAGNQRAQQVLDQLLADEDPKE